MQQTEILHVTAELRTCDLDGFSQAVRAAAAWLESNRERINALNVFPVPDGDTGDNMALTMRGALKALDCAPEYSLGAMCDALADGALQASRGNSGVILSQMLGGFTRELKRSGEITPQSLAAAFTRASEEGYRSHSDPVEGTMMTVARDFAAAATALADAGAPMPRFLRSVLSEARASVARTREILPRLREAGVVDAGGEGLAVLLEGAARRATGEELDDPAPPTQPADFSSLDVHEGDTFGYCTNFMLHGEDLDVAAFREFVLERGSSALVVGHSRCIKVHVHTEVPGDLLSHALSLGILHQIKIDNMDDQFEAAKGGKPEATPPRTVTTALVAVAPGAGFARLFESDAGAVVVGGGQSANPSTGDLLNAIERAPSEDVILLPNNPNVIMAAQRAAESCAKRVRILPTLSAAVGVTAALAYDPNAPFERNTEEMEGAVASAHGIELTLAVRDAEIGRVRAREGEYVALLDDELVAAGPQLPAVLVAALELASPEEKELLTLYTGRDADPGEAEEAARAVRNRWPELEVDVHVGGQPHYPLVASIE